MDIALEPKAFARAQSGAITGPIWLRHEGIAFPEKGWSDFPVIVLGWWLTQLLALGQGARSALCSFMDGPYDFSVSTEAPGLFRLKLTQRGAKTNSLVSEFTIDASALRASLLAAAASTLAECDRRGWSGRDVEDLHELHRFSRH